MRAVLSHARAECYVCVRLFEVVVFGDCRKNESKSGAKTIYIVTGNQKSSLFSILCSTVIEAVCSFHILKLRNLNQAL